MNLAYLLPAESLQLVRELRYDVITLAFEFAESESDPEEEGGSDELKPFHV